MLIEHCVGRGDPGRQRKKELGSRDGQGRLAVSRQREGGMPEARLNRGSREGEWTK